MALKDRFRRAIGRDGTSDRASISSGSTGKNTGGSTTPTNFNQADTLSPLSTIQTAQDTSKPSITLTKTHSLLGKTLTWHSSSSTEKKSKQEIMMEKKLKQWAKSDDVEWTSPMDRRSGKKDVNCQNTLRAFDLGRAERNGSSARRSIASGVSPNHSRVNSIDEGVSMHALATKRESIGPGKLSMEVTR